MVRDSHQALAAEAGSASLTLVNSNARWPIGMSIVALLWNALSAPMTVPLVHKVFGERETAAAFGFVFPLIGLVLLFWAAREVARRLLFGLSRLHLDAGEVSVGGILEGRITNSRNPAFEGNYTVRLRCQRVVRTGSGDSSSTHTPVLWSRETTVDRESHDLQRGVPVKFELPRHLQATDTSKPDSQVQWVLELRAPTRPTPFLAVWYVPVGGAAPERRLQA